MRARTSQTHPLQIVDLAPGRGRIGITFCPGKHDPAAATGAWARDLDADLDAITAWGADLVLTLVEPAELRALKVPHLGAAVRARGLDWCHLPIADYSVPDAGFEAAWGIEGRKIRARLAAGGAVLVHCKGGLGRAGMIAARLLVELGMPADAAIRATRQARPGAIETPAQLAAVRRAVPQEGAVEAARLERISAGRGSGEAGLFRDAAGRRFYVKRLESPAHARNEWLAARLYRLAGAPTLDYLPAVEPDRIVTAFLDLDKRRIGQFDETERRQAQHWLGVHAWTANWDAAGFAGDNQGVVGDRVLTLDLGGALEFRALGCPKGRAFGPCVGEIDRLRSDPDNPEAVRLFGGMTADAVRAAVGVVTALADSAIRRAVADGGGRPALAEKLIARRDDMARQVGGSAGKP